MTEKQYCEEHPGELLKRCCVCDKFVCGICHTYVNPLTNFAITKKVWEAYPKSVKLIGAEWPKETKVAHLKCAKKANMIESGFAW